VDERVRALLRRYGPDAMRWTLALVFVWFGALKVANVTPVAGLVADTLAFVPIPSAVVVLALGVFEIVAGALLAAGRMPRPVLAVLVGHLTGTRDAVSRPRPRRSPPAAARTGRRGSPPAASCG
jgi:uncharacterized membrane protein YphA (DoxX/SURF4 family)